MEIKLALWQALCLNINITLYNDVIQNRWIWRAHMFWTKEMFRTKKPIIGLLHLEALPGDPFYKGSMKEVIECARKDLDALQKGGVDGILITNEMSLPYQKHISTVTVASMARVIGALEAELSLPFGAEAIYDPEATIELCAAVDADFSRCVFTGAYVGDLGIIDHDVSRSLRLRRYLERQDLRLFFFVNSEGEVLLNDRGTEEIVKTMMFNCRPDALVAAGSMAGVSPDGTLLETTAKAAGGRLPVFCGTGCREDTIENIFKTADGAFVGTTFKKNAALGERIELGRVRRFMAAARAARGDR